MSGEHIVAIAAGDFHSLALSAAGGVYCTGLNSLGECGLGHIDRVPTFEAVPLLELVSGCAPLALSVPLC